MDLGLRRADPRPGRGTGRPVAHRPRRTRPPPPRDRPGPVHPLRLPARTGGPEPHRDVGGTVRAPGRPAARRTAPAGPALPRAVRRRHRIRDSRPWRGPVPGAAEPGPLRRHRATPPAHRPARTAAPPPSSHRLLPARRRPTAPPGPVGRTRAALAHRGPHGGAPGPARRPDARGGAGRTAPLRSRPPPLLRFALLRTGERRWRLVFTHHHLLLDGWSVPLVLRELLDPDATGEPAPALGEYARWLAARDQGAAAEAWRRELAGAEPTRVAGHAPAAPTALSHRFELSEELARALSDRAAHWGVTLNTLVESAWALLLNHLTGRQDVVFGVTVAQRPPRSREWNTFPACC
ncbi:condensation domain-containing protein [Streptomyces albus]|nr:condensation domain-containing protein [Streptomyces albus]